VPRLPRPRAPRTDQELYVYVGVAAVLLLYAIGFVATNAKQVEIDFLLFSTSISLIWLVMLTFLLGVAVGLAFGPLRARARRRRAAAAAPPQDAEPPPPSG
jgi:uncharacterized integral membrane protein